MLNFDSDADELVTELRQVGQVFQKHNTALDRRVNELEQSINDIHRRQQRPGAEGDYEPGFARKDALQMCMDRHSWERQKSEGREVEYAPSSDEIESAMIAQRAFHKILRHGRLERLDHLEQKSLSSFSFGGAGWVVPPKYPAASSRA